jgi:hypothetical protein
MKLSLWLAGVFLVVSPLAVPCRAETITSAIRKEDPRLDKPVTFVSPRIYVGDLLEALSAQSGVEIIASERDGAADEQIFVHLTGVKLGDALDSLWSLLSYQKATYSWERLGEPGKYRYRLVRTLAAQKLAQRFQNMAQELFEKQAAMLLEATRLEPSERRPLITKMVKEVLAGSDKMIELYLNDERTWEYLNIFSEALSPENQLRLLRGQQKYLKALTSEMSDRGKQFIHKLAEVETGYIKKPDGTLVPQPEPAYVMFWAEENGLKEVSRSLHVDVDHHGGSSYIGGLWMHNAIRKKVRELWMLPDDSLDNPLSARTVPRPLKPEAIPERRNALEFRLQELATDTPVSIMARLPENFSYDPGSPQEQTVKAFLEHISEFQYSLYLQTKWRKDILLVDYPAWFHDDDAKVMLRIAKHFRQSAAENKGFLTLQNLAEAARLLSPEQIKRLAGEFPVMHNVPELRDILNSACPSPQAAAALASEGGIPLTEETAAAVQAHIYMKYVWGEATFKAVRMIAKEHPDRTPPSREYTIGLVTAEGRWRPVSGFYDTANNRKPKNEAAKP